MFERIRQKLADLPIARKIWLMTFCIFLVFILSLTIIFNVTVSNVVMKIMDSETSNNLRTVEDKLNSMLNMFGNYTKLAISDSGLQDAMRRQARSSRQNYDTSSRIVESLAPLIIPRTDIESMAVVNQYGNVYTTNLQTQLDDPEFVEFLEHKLTPMDRVWYGPVISYDSINSETLDVIPYYMKIYDGLSGSYLGIMETYIAVRSFSDVLSSIILNNGSRIYMLDGSGTIVASSSGLGVGEKLSQSTFRVITDNVGKGLCKNDREYYNIEAYHMYDWMIVSIIPADILESPIQAFYIFSISIVVILSILLLIISVVIAYSITRPIREMDSTISSFENPKEKKYAPVYANDEVGHLANAYNEMLDRIGSYVESDRKKQLELRHYELNLMQNQINPHFLNNILENICGLIELDRKQESIGLVQDLAEFYRNILAGGEMVISLEQEFKIVDLYIRMLNVRYSGRINYELTLPDELKAYPIVKFTLQPLIENAIEHGLKGLKHEWKLEAVCMMNENDITVTIRDNGRGMTPEQLSALLEGQRPVRNGRERVGSYITDQRLKLYFGDKYGLTYESAVDEGTTVMVRMPKEPDIESRI